MQAADQREILAARKRAVLRKGLQCVVFEEMPFVQGTHKRGNVTKHELTKK